jgi:hypothetical protein
MRASRWLFVSTTIPEHISGMQGHHRCTLTGGLSFSKLQQIAVYRRRCPDHHRIAASDLRPVRFRKAPALRAPTLEAGALFTRREHRVEAADATLSVLAWGAVGVFASTRHRAYNLHRIANGASFRGDLPRPRPQGGVVGGTCAFELPGAPVHFGEERKHPYFATAATAR